MEVRLGGGRWLRGEWELTRKGVGTEKGKKRSWELNVQVGEMETGIRSEEDGNLTQTITMAYCKIALKYRRKNKIFCQFKLVT